MFEITLPRETLIGPGKFLEAGGMTEGKKVLLVVSGSVLKTYDGKIKSAFRGRDLTIFDGVKGEPEVGVVDACAQACKKAGCEAVAAIGGGSVLDCAKAVAFLATNPGLMSEYQLGEKTIEKPPLPFLAVPTTAGTGSEGTRVAVITNKKEGIKKSVIHRWLVPRTAILDPELCVTVPARVTALTAIDALCHAIESYVSLNAQPITEAFGLKSVGMIAANLKKAVDNGSDLQARENMLVASYLAGLSLVVGVGMAHMLAQPVGATYGTSHSEGITALLPWVMRANAKYSSEKYIGLAKALGGKGTAPEEAADMVERLYESVGIKPGLAGYGVKEEKFEAILASAKKSTMHIKTNPRPVDDRLLKEVLKNAL